MGIRRGFRIAKNLARAGTGSMSDAEKSYRNWRIEASDECFSAFFAAEKGSGEREFERGRFGYMAEVLPSKKQEYAALEQAQAPAQEHAADWHRGYAAQRDEVERRARAAGMPHP